MEEDNDSSWCEPLNLVKKKTKPVAVVAPSAVVETCEKNLVDEDKEKNVENEVLKVEQETKITTVNEKVFEIGSLGKSNKDENEIETFKNTLAKDSKISNGGVYSMFHSLAACEQNFLTALYMGSLMNSRVIPSGSSSSVPVPLPYPIPTSPSLLSGNWPSSSLQSDNLSESQSLSPFFAQQRFWQMVNWAEAQKLNSDQNLKNLTSVTESLTITVPTNDQSSPVYPTKDALASSTLTSKTKNSDNSLCNNKSNNQVINFNSKNLPNSSTVKKSKSIR